MAEGRHQHGHQHGHQDHGHGGHDSTHPDWVAMIPHLERNAEVYAPLYTQAMAWLRGTRPGGTGVIVDVGSGPGVVSCRLAEEFPQAKVVAADPEEGLLARAAERAAREGLADRVSTLRVELPHALDELPAADLMWAARSLHHVGDQRAAIAALAGRLAPGGTLALIEGGLPWRSLPRDFGMGRAGLQTRMDALEEEWFADMRASVPDSKADTEDWAGLLTDAGLVRPASRTFLLDLPAPLDPRARELVVELWRRRRDSLPQSVPAEDAAVLDRLLDPEDPQSLHRREDLFLLTAHTVHTAVKEA
ncbi:class I SAM-dependent methyltransferase [Streptomyces sp. NPDC059524]|uniref:class I SAM-dependent methyltransferase n=1 Tax=Streptomyces sp. NPDC059524 TaxID=3346856 RepID=UPI0036C777A3